MHADIFVNAPEKSTENAHIIQACLDAGGEIHVLNEGTVFVSDTLRLRSDTHLRLGENTVLSLAAHANRPLLTARKSTKRLSRISISGGTIDYNQSAQSTPGGTLDTMCVIFEGVDGVKIEHCKGINTSKYVFLFSDCADVRISDIVFDTPSDGIHFQGPCSDIELTNISGTTGDDMVAFTLGDYAKYELSRGDICNIAVDGLYPNGSKSAIKFAGNPGCKFRNVTLNSIRGTVKDFGVVVLTDDNLSNTTLEDLTIDRMEILSTSGRAGVLINGNCFVERLTLSNVTADGTGHGSGYTFIRVVPGSSVKFVLILGARTSPQLGSYAMLRGTLSIVVVTGCEFGEARYGVRIHPNNGECNCYFSGSPLTNASVADFELDNRVSSPHLFSSTHKWIYNSIA